MPCPIGLVVKNGSNARAITSGVMPVPVSVTQSETYCPGGRSRSRAARSSSHLLAVSMVSRPPPGAIASRALMQRLSSAFSSCEGIDLRRPQPAGADHLDRRCPAPPCAGSALPSRRSACWRRPAWDQASAGARTPAASASGTPPCARPPAPTRCSAPRPSSRPSAIRFSSSSRLPLMPPSRLLKSCAMPPVSWPTASSCWRSGSRKGGSRACSATSRRRRRPRAGRHLSRRDCWRSRGARRSIPSRSMPTS